MMEPREVAKLILDRVIDYCESSNLATMIEIVECIGRHSPKDLGKYRSLYLSREEKESVKQVAKSSRKFWDEVKREYEKLWDEKMSLELGKLMSDEITEFYNDIIRHMFREEELKDYANALSQLRDRITLALMEMKPIPGHKLNEWFLVTHDTLYGYESRRYDLVDHIAKYYSMLRKFYRMLSDHGKLNVLKTLLFVINNVMHDIDKDLKELSESGALTNNR